MDRLTARIEQQLDSPIAERHSLGGGSINDAWRIELADGRALFLKTHGQPPRDFFAAEAEGLRALASTDTIRIPVVIAEEDDYLLLEWLDGKPAADYWPRFGEQLAALHSHHAERFGFGKDNFCGLTPQPNPWTRDGFTFFAESRLLHQGRMARDTGKLEQSDVKQLEWLAGRLDRWLPKQPASLIHGDLWGGNAHCGPEGEPVLIDPAAHYGWAEAELAMTTLFGRFPRAFYEAYQANSGIASDWESRTPLYNLYHELNHLNLFGGAYAQGVRRTLKRYAGDVFT